MTSVMYVTFNAKARRREYQGATIEFRGFSETAIRDGFLMFEFPEGRIEGFNVSTVEAYVYIEEKT
jgi:hypothetical protein